MYNTNAATQDSLREALSYNFGFDSFKGQQREIIESVLDGKDTLVIMPTGGGKSLCYQLPAIINEGTALIISPLIALMKNQVDMVRGYSERDNIAHFMNSSLSRTELKKVKSDLLDGNTKMLYVAPETLTKEETIEFFQQMKISFVAIDEAHCISEWGHDFRPEYRRIRQMVDAIDRNVPIVALTATATPKVREDIIKNLSMSQPAVFLESFNRDNLFYETRPKGKKADVMRQIVQFIRTKPNRSGIIYCLNRKTTEEIAETLEANGISAAAYHAGLDSPTRSARQDAFLREEVNVIVATIAFGMGIDKPDVRFVIHYNMPKSLENYYQETGRAGRDGLEGVCLGFFSYSDMSKLEKFLRDKPVAEREIGGQHLAEVIAYAETAGCRRKFLLHYFGEEYDESQCTGLCDNCKNPKNKKESKEALLLLIHSLEELRENFVSKYVVKFLLGKKAQDILSFNHHQLPSFGKGGDETETYWNSIITHALLNNLIRKDIENYGLLKITEKGREFTKSPHSVKIPINHNMEDTSSESDVVIGKQDRSLDPDLFNRLKHLRKKVAAQNNVPTYAVFQERSLEEMSTYYPVSKEELENIWGVSNGKVRKYGRPFLKLIAEYVEENDIERAADFVIKSVASKSKDKIYIIHNIDKRIPLENIAAYLQLNMDEMITEIEKIVDSGTKLNLDYHINEVLDEYQQQDLFEYFMESESDAIRDAFNELGTDEYTEEDIRLMRIKFMSEVAH